MPTPKPIRMTADRFVVWAMEQPDGQRHELAGGEVIAVAPARTAPARAKRDVLQALSDSILATSPQCEALPDGMAVHIDDAAVRCGPRLTDEAVEYDDPIVVIEVLSPSTRARDSGAKLEDYFRLRSMRHYMIVKTDTRCVIHHGRSDDGAIATSIRHTGSLRLDPPGIGIEIDDIFANLDP